ncbi:MAG: type II toxin-antitoxin system HicB family antitoxin [Verrucomicrobiota bacterium]
MRKSLTAIIQKEGDGYSALCPEIDVASQGDTIEAAKQNLREAVELFFECASEAEVKERLNTDSFVSSLEVDGA